MNPDPLISLVIPAFNPRFFRRALTSALTQSFENFEIIVCDDSPDHAIERIVESLAADASVPLRYVRNPQRLGFAGNLLAGVQQARGELIKFLCDDDLLFPACLALQSQVLNEHPDVSLVLAQRHFWDSEGVQLPARLENSPLATTSSLFKGDDLLSIIEIYPRNVLGGLSSALMRRADVLELLPALTQPGQGFVATLDFMLFVCLIKRGNPVVLSQVLSVERLHPERLSRQQAIKDLADTEMRWLQQMLNVRTTEQSPPRGWVRYVPLDRAAEVPRVWDELSLNRSLGNRQATLPWRVGSTSESFSELYAQWLACRTLSTADRSLMTDVIARWPTQPKIVVVVLDESGGRARLGNTLTSLADQLYAPELTLVLSSACEEAALSERVFNLPLQDDWRVQLNELLPQLDGAHWFYLLRAGDQLIDSALLMLAERIALKDAALCIYSDEGGLQDGEPVAPVFKSDFNLDFMRSYPYVGRTLAFSRRAFVELGGFDAGFAELAPQDLLWRMVERDGLVVVEHISEVLVQSPFTFAQWLGLPEVLEQAPQILHAHLQRLGVAHRISQGPHALISQVQYLHDDQPLVSIIIAHKDQLAPLQRCIETLLGKTDYPRFELLIVDHGSTGAEAQAWLAAMAQMGSDKFRVLHVAADTSAALLRNTAAAEARGEYLLMLSPYAAVTEGDWLQALLNHAQRPEVGVVGAKLFSAEGYVLHAGMILGFQGPVGRAFFGEPFHASGYMQRLQVAQNVSVIGADCFMVRRALFEQLGGLDTTAFADSLAEADLCLRVRDSGHLVVWTPQALLALGAREPAAISPRRSADQEAFYLRWLPLIARDPAYNRNLRLEGSCYSLEPGFKSGWSPFSSRQLPSVLAIPVNTSAVGHYRVAQPFVELQAAGRAVGRLAYDTPSVIEIERQSPDVIVLQGRYTQSTVDEITTLKKYSNARRIYELDDYVVSVPEKNSHMYNMPTDMGRLVQVGASLCDRIVVSTQPLADALAAMHHDIRVVPNMLAPHLWSGMRSRRRTSPKPRVGWGGGTSHTGDLEIIAEVVRELADEVDWVFFGMCPPDLRPFMREFHPSVGLQAYPAKLASLNLDLALAPLEHHIFNDCKSNLRLLEYGACGYPVVCSDTLAYRGYLPCTRVPGNTTAQWLEAIRMHLADPDASYRMGDELRTIVQRDYMLRADNLQHWVHGWLAD